jgi:hypothetical protein
MRPKARKTGSRDGLKRPFTCVCLEGDFPAMVCCIGVVKFPPPQEWGQKECLLPPRQPKIVPGEDCGLYGTS